MARPRKEKPNRADGLYEVKITIGKKLDGTLIRKSFYSSISKLEAKKEAEQYKINREVSDRMGLGFVSKDIDFTSWANEWLETYKKPNVKLSTYENTYKNTVCNHLIPCFGAAKLSDITPIDIQKFYNTKCCNLSDSAINKIKICLNAIFSVAIDNDLCAKNPCKNVTIPKANEKTIKRTLSLEQTLLASEFAKQHVYGLDIMLLIELGLRRSELMGLMWSDIDLDNRYVEINRGVTLEGNKVHVGNPKSKTSIRKLPISTEFALYLTPHKSAGFVIPNANGGAMSPNNWERRRYSKFMGDLIDKYPDIPRLTPHEMRHTCGTNLYNKTGNIYAVSKFLGHADINITTKIYVHSDIESLRQTLLLD